MFGIKEIDAATLLQWRESGQSFRLIDVRTPAETAQGIIEGAELLPLHLLPLSLDQFRANESLVIYCRTGARSGQACAFLAQHGLSNAHNLRGGIMAWAMNRYPVVLPDQR